MLHEARRRERWPQRGCGAVRRPRLKFWKSRRGSGWGNERGVGLFFPGLPVGSDDRKFPRRLAFSLKTGTDKGRYRVPSSV